MGSNPVVSWQVHGKYKLPMLPRKPLPTAGVLAAALFFLRGRTLPYETSNVLPLCEAES